MRKSASEIIGSLEQRVARLEKFSSSIVYTHSRFNTIEEENRAKRNKNIGKISGRKLAELIPLIIRNPNCRASDKDVKKAMNKFLKSEYGTTLRSVSFSETKQENTDTAQGIDVHITGKMHIKRKDKSIDSYNDVYLVFLCSWDYVWIQEYTVGYTKWQKLP